jgi:hypothetical protein
MKKLLILLSILIGITACSDILEEEPKAVAIENFYNSASEIESAVLSIYSPISNNNTFGAMYIAQMEAQSDYGYGRGSYAPVSEFQGLDATNIGRVADFWSSFYRSIRNANLVIKNAPDAIDVNESTLNELIGEAKFLRALCYFHLVRNWGDIPLRNESNMLELELARTPASEIYSFIIQDLEFAENHMVESESVPGRATKWAAKTLLTEVYLQLERWQDARNKALEVINSNKYELISVDNSDDFYKIFGPDIITSKEEIFYIKYNSTQSSNLAYFIHHPGSPYFNGAGWYAHYTDSVNNKQIKDWDYNDLRKSFNLYYYDISISPTTVLFKKYIDPERVNAGRNDYPIYRYPELLLFYAEAECRMNNGPTAEAMEKLNMVHRRGYGKNPYANSNVDYDINNYNMESFIDLIFQEKMYETIWEGKRWLDLKRIGKVKETIMEAYGINVADKHLWWPIPENEFEYNDAIDPEKDQNFGY